MIKNAEKSWSLASTRIAHFVCSDRSYLQSLSSSPRRRSNQKSLFHKIEGNKLKSKVLGKIFPDWRYFFTLIFFQKTLHGNIMNFQAFVGLELN